MRAKRVLAIVTIAVIVLVFTLLALSGVRVS